MSESSFYRGKIIACVSLVNYAKKRWPKRDVIADVHVPHGEMYYITRQGLLRLIKVKTEIWANPLRRIR